MIRSFAHKGLEVFFTTGSKAGIQPQHAQRLRLILALVDGAKVVRDVGSPGLNLHPLVGKLAGQWAVTVRANWRITFTFDDATGEALVLNYVDYH